MGHMHILPLELNKKIINNRKNIRKILKKFLYIEKAFKDYDFVDNALNLKDFSINDT